MEMSQSEESSSAEPSLLSEEGADSRTLEVSRVFIPSGSIQLEALVSGAADSIGWPSSGVIVTHPMPLLGGDLENNVVQALFRHFTHRGAVACCFNFRGVGKSGGSGSWRGGSERDDVKAVAQYLLKTHATVRRLLLVGYSYGSVIAASVADELPEIAAFAAISYPFGPLWFMGLSPLLKYAQDSQKPKLFVIGDADNFSSVSRFTDRVAELCEPKTSLVLSGADHFWFRGEKQLAESVSNWAERVLFEKNVAS